MGDHQGRRRPAPGQSQKLIEEGNVRRVVIKQGDRTLAEFPLMIGVVGAVIAPVLAAVGAIAALVTHCKIEGGKGADEVGFGA